MVGGRARPRGLLAHPMHRSCTQAGALLPSLSTCIISLSLFDAALPTFGILLSLTHHNVSTFPIRGCNLPAQRCIEGCFCSSSCVRALFALESHSMAEKTIQLDSSSPCLCWVAGVAVGVLFVQIVSLHLFLAFVLFCSLLCISFHCISH